MVHPAEVLEEVRRRGITVFEGGVERLSEPAEPAEPTESERLETTVQEIVRLGGLKSSAIRDLEADLRAQARAVPGFLRRDGKSSLELAQAHSKDIGESGWMKGIAILELDQPLRAPDREDLKAIIDTIYIPAKLLEVW